MGGIRHVQSWRQEFNRIISSYSWPEGAGRRALRCSPIRLWLSVKKDGRVEFRVAKGLPRPHFGNDLESQFGLDLKAYNSLAFQNAVQ